MIPIILMSHGNPIAFAIAPPAEGPSGNRELGKLSADAVAWKDGKVRMVFSRLSRSCRDKRWLCQADPLPIAYPIQKATSAMAYTLP